MGGEGLLGVLHAARRQWLLVAAVALPLFLGAVLYAETLPSEYDAVAVVGFSPREDRNPSADVVRLLLPKYTVYITSGETMSRVAEDLDTTTRRLERGLDPSIPAETATLRIAFRDRSPDFAAQAANSFALRGLAFAAGDPVVEASLVASATVPTGPAGPPRKLIEAAAAAVAAILGVAVALLVERSRPRVRTMAEVSAATGMRVVGRLPRRRSLRGHPLDGLGDPIIGSAVRSARTSIDRESRDTPVQVLAVTSSVEGEGKSTFTSLFAAALARLDAKVLLVDGDFVRPRLARRFDALDEASINDVLRKDITLADAVQEVVPGLHLLPARPEAEAGDLVARRFGEVLNEARSRYDIVVIDAPPMIGSDLGGTMAALAEAVVFVVRAGTFASAVRQAVSALHAVGARVLGVVANGLVDPTEAYYLADDRH